MANLHQSGCKKMWVMYVKVAWLFECGESNVDVMLKLKLSLKPFIHWYVCTITIKNESILGGRDVRGCATKDWGKSRNTKQTRWISSTFNRPRKWQHLYTVNFGMLTVSFDIWGWCPEFFFLHLQLFLKRFQCQLRVICTWAIHKVNVVNLQLFGSLPSFRLIAALVERLSMPRALFTASWRSWSNWSRRSWIFMWRSLLSHWCVWHQMRLSGTHRECLHHPSLSRIQPGGLRKRWHHFQQDKHTSNSLT